MTKPKKTPKRQPKGIDEQLRAAIEGSELSLYAIAQASGVHYPQVHNFANAKNDIRLGTAVKLARFLGLQLVPMT